jgi:hypothetical protein
MKLHSLTKLLLGTALLLGATAATDKPATAEDNTRIVCIDRSRDGHTECERVDTVEQQSVELCDRHPDNYCENEHPQEVERPVYPRRQVHPREVEHREHPRFPVHPREVERRVHPRRVVEPRVENPNSTAVLHRFYCNSSEDGVPTTFVETAQGTYPVIRWVSDYFTPHGYDQTTRCRQVSDKFQTHFNDGSLNYITTGVVNHQPVICVSDTNGGTCQGVLFTLKPEQNASRIIQRLFDLRSGAASGPLEETGSRLYLNFNRYLEDTVKRR